jgi:hypothetical protein
VKKAPLGRILCNFRLRMHKTYFRTWPLPITSLPVTWLTSLPVKHAQWSDPHRYSANVTLSVPIYYWYTNVNSWINKLFFFYITFREWHLYGFYVSSFAACMSMRIDNTMLFVYLFKNVFWAQFSSERLSSITPYSIHDAAHTLSMFVRE